MAETDPTNPFRDGTGCPLCRPGRGCNTPPTGNPPTALHSCPHRRVPQTGPCPLCRNDNRPW